jgi:WD40 repeat protein
MHGYPRKPSQVCFGGGGRWLATSGGETPLVWSFEDGGPENTDPIQLPVHTLPVSTLAAASHYSALASGGRDGGVVVWKVDGGDSQIVGFAMCGAPIEQLAFRPDDLALAGVTRGSELEVWRCRLSKMRT